MENWKDVKGFEGIYQVSDLGNVKRLGRWATNSLGVKKFYKCKDLKPSLTKSGYYHFVFRKNGKKINYRLNRIVAEAFLENPLNKPCVNHINGIKTDNRLINLEWATNKENVNHAERTGLFKRFRKLSLEDVKKIKEIYVFNSKEYSIPKLAKMFNCSETSIWNIVNNQGSYKKMEV